MSPVFRSPLPYFGNTALWTALLEAERAIWLASEHYQRRSQRNRTVIANAHGRQTLSIPLLGGKHQQCPIREVRISYAENWRRQHFLSLRAAYGSAPYWLEYVGELEEQYASTFDTLWAWNTSCTELVIRWLGVPVDAHCGRDWCSSTDASPVGLRPEPRLRTYPQVFTERTGWLSNLSILDLILCHGPAAAGYLAPNP